MYPLHRFAVPLSQRERLRQSLRLVTDAYRIRLVTATILLFLLQTRNSKGLELLDVFLLEFFFREHAGEAGEVGVDAGAVLADFARFEQEVALACVAEDRLFRRRVLGRVRRRFARGEVEADSELLPGIYVVEAEGEVKNVLVR